MPTALGIGLGIGYGDSSFSPSSISGLLLWLKADSLALSNGNSVTTWGDSSGNGHDMTFNVNAGNAGGTAVYNTNVLNGKPVVRLAGGGNFTNSLGDTISQPITIFSVSTTKDGFYLFDGINSTNRIVSYCVGNVHFFAGGDIDSGVASSNSFADFCFVSNTTSSAVYKNGTLAATGNIGTNSITGFTLNNRNERTETINNNEFAEFIVYLGALSDTDRIKVQNYISSKYGI